MLTAISTMSFAQQELFEQYDDVEGVETVYISASMLRMMRNIKAGNKDISRIAGRLERLQILNCERTALIPTIRKTAVTIFNKRGYHIVMQTSGGGEHVTIYEKKYRNGRNEYVLMAIEKNELSVINVFGKVSLQDIQGIAGGK